MLLPFIEQHPYSANQSLFESKNSEGKGIGLASGMSYMSILDLSYCTSSFPHLQFEIFHNHNLINIVSRRLFHLDVVERVTI